MYCISKQVPMKDHWPPRGPILAPETPPHIRRRGEVTGYGSFEGITIPTAGCLGWHYGTDRWPDGEFVGERYLDHDSAGNRMDTAKVIPSPAKITTPSARLTSRRCLGISETRTFSATAMIADP